MSAAIDLVDGTLSWLEIDAAALAHNVRALASAVRAEGPPPLTCAMVKGNAYGHGLIESSRVFAAAGVDWLGVGELAEVRRLRRAGLATPLYCVNYLAADQVAEAVGSDVRFVIYDPDVVAAAAAAARTQGRVARLHLKVETGTHRQGLDAPAAAVLAARIAADPHLHLEGIATHFADVEDTTDHRFAHDQLRRFEAAVSSIRVAVAALNPAAPAPLAHASNTAAVLLWPDRVGADLIRFGIGAYGMWPSAETYVSRAHLDQGQLELWPALTWKTRIAQIRDVPTGAWVGYGRTFEASRDSRIAVLPVGYYDGYDRGLSNTGQVLVGGKRAPVVGRVSMNMIAVDVTDSPHAHVGAEVVLLGRQAAQHGGPGDEISARRMASWLGTIHYEVTTRIHERLPRRVVGTVGP